MLFGEIVEPSTRALTEDDYEDYYNCPEDEPTLDWSCNFETPSSIDSLILVEGVNAIQSVTAFLLSDEEIQVTLRNGHIKIYKQGDNYIITYVPKELTPGEIVELLSDWFKAAKNIYAIATQPMVNYQQMGGDKPESIVRLLTVPLLQSEFSGRYKVLEAPNLVSGLGAGVLTFCRHWGLKCALFVIYMDNSPLDSLNTRHILDLLKDLKLSIKTTELHLNNFPSNLYL